MRPMYDFWHMIDDARSSNRALPRLHPSSGFYPSSASIEKLEYGRKVVKGTCLRKMYWQSTGEPKTNLASPDLMWRAEMGNWISEMLVDWCKRAGTYVADELKFVDPVNKISGRVDLVYQHPVTKDFVGVEVKSIGDYYQRKGTVTGFPMKPKIHHLLQTILYLDYFERSERMPIKVFELVYIARCTGERNCFRITKDSSTQILVDGAPSGITAEMIYRRFRQLEKHLEEGALPDRDFDLQYSKEKLKFLASTDQLTKKQKTLVLSGKKLKKGDGACSWCSYKTKCWEE